MTKVSWSAFWTLLGALLFFIGTVFHPPLTNPWDVTYAYKEMTIHHHWILDHWLFLIGLTLWLLGLSYLADLQNHSMRWHPTGGLIGARCFIGSLVLWFIILAVEIAVLPPLAHLIRTDDQAAQLIWNALFTWGLFAGYLAMILIYIGVIFLSLSYKEKLKKNIGSIAGTLGIAGTLLSLLFPNIAIFLQLVTSPWPFLWTVWFAINNIKLNIKNQK